MPTLLHRDGTLLRLQDLDRLFGAETSLINTFTVPWPDERGWEAAVGPDGDFAVFCKDDAVRAVTPTGAVLWEHRGHEGGTTADRSSCRVTDDGRYILIDATTGKARGDVRYPVPMTGFARPLADGTWLTAENDTLFRSRTPAPAAEPGFVV